jgi:ectoine hydroxylase-related dioxygenase (phytanoyl-CoA dioxygenase family)
VLSEEQWDRYDRDGYLHLGQVVDDATLDALRTRVDDLASGRLTNPEVEFQMDTGGEYEQLPGAVRQLEPGTVRYRKVQGLEYDGLYADLVRHPVFVEICAHVYGPHAPVSLFRAMVMNKPAGQGTLLPWHQDGGSVWALDRDPLVTVWVALDDATPENGCMDIVPGSHRLGLLSWYGSTVADEHVELYCQPESCSPLPVEAGSAVLVHNWLLHRSGVNPTAAPRRAFTCCFMDGRTRSDLTGALFPSVWGELHEEASYLAQLKSSLAEMAEGHRQAEEYALSLKADNEYLRASMGEATRYARSLEAEREAASSASPEVPASPNLAVRGLTPSNRAALVSGLASGAAVAVAGALPRVLRRVSRSRD